MNQKALFHVTENGLPISFLSAIHEVSEPNAIRIAGGCKGISQTKEQIIEYFLYAFAGYKGILFSGGTQNLNPEGEKSFMITEVPVLIAEKNEDIKVLGTFPRTDQMTVQGQNAALHLNDYGDQPNPNYDSVLLVQESVNKTLGWDGDLPLYFEAMDAWKKVGANTAVLVYNGGDVTYDEAKKALELGHKLIIVDKSGRKADELATELVGQENVYIANADDAESLRAILQTLVFVS